MKETRKILMTVFLTGIVLPLLLVAVFETSLLNSGALADEAGMEFLLVMLTELCTLAAIPMALRLFKFKAVAHDLKTRRERGLLKWGLIRLALLEGMLLLNVILYYLFMNTTFGYMGIILLLCLPFTYPSTDRCLTEIGE